MKVAIVGAGISGLSAAHFLKNKYQVRVFEKEERPGGLIKCRRVNGSLFHICGGHVFNSKRKDVLDWFWSKFDIDSEFTKAERNSVVFMEDGKEIPYPIENHMYLFDQVTQKKYIEDLIFMTKNEVTAHNFEDFLKGRFGETLYNLYFKPYNEKVWHRNLRNVPLAWLEGKLPMPTVSEMIYNNFNHVKEKEFVHSAFWYEKVNGSQYIADKLAQDIDIHYNSDIQAIRKIGDKWQILDDVYDKVIFCGNIKNLIKIIEGVDLLSYNKEIEKLEYHGTTSVFCEIDKNPYSWIYQPSRKHESHRIICTGNFASTNNSPKLSDNRITATIEFTDQISKENILENIARMPLHPKFLDFQYNQFTYPIQDANTREVIRELKTVLSLKDFYFTGRFADWEYYNMDVAIGAAMDTCRAISS